MFDIIIFDAGSGLHHSHIKQSINAADHILIIAEPSPRCLQAVLEYRKTGKLINNIKQLLVINRVSKNAYYHPRDIARRFGTEENYRIVEECTKVNESTKDRLPLVMYGRGRSCASIQKVVKEIICISKTGTYIDEGKRPKRKKNLFSGLLKKRPKKDSLAENIIQPDVILNSGNPATVVWERDGIKAESHAWFKRLISSVKSTEGSETPAEDAEALDLTVPIASNPDSKTSNKLLLKKQGNTIMVISGESGGKTTVAVNLAVILSMQGYTVGFIDGDLQSLAAHRLVGGVSAGGSLLYALQNPRETPKLLDPVPFAPQLYALTADQDNEIDAKLYSRLPKVIKRMAANVDIVVVDTPPEAKAIRRLTKIAGHTVVIVSPGENLDKKEVLKIPNPILVLNRWLTGMEVSLGEEIYGLRASCVIPELSEIQEAEHGGVPAVLGCTQLYRSLNAVAEKIIL